MKRLRNAILPHESITFKMDEDLHPIPVPDVLLWASNSHLRDLRSWLGDDDIGDVRVSTAFLGVSASPIIPKPFETMIFVPGGPAVMDRYASWPQAMAAHRWFVAYVKRVHARGEQFVLNAAYDDYRALPLCEILAGVSDVLIEQGIPPDEALMRATLSLQGKLHVQRIDGAGYCAITPQGLGQYAIVADLGRDAEIPYGGVWRYDSYEAAKAAFDAWGGMGEPAGAAERWVAGEE